MIYTRTFEVGGKTFSIEVGRVAKQANGSVLLGMEETVLLATATMSHEPREGVDFLPLTCDFELRPYALGRIPGGFIKRGGKPSDQSILTSRLIDRPIRPLFPKGLRNDVQVIVMPFAVDPKCPPDVLAICAAGAALTVSDIPFDGPVAGVRVARINGNFVLFPSTAQMLDSDMDIVVAGHMDAVSMIEAGCNEVSEKDVMAAVAFGHEAIKKICAELKVVGEEAGKKKAEVKLFTIDEDLIKVIQEGSRKEISETIVNPDKLARESAVADLTKELIEKYIPQYESELDKIAMLPGVIDKVIKDTIREMILEKEKRPDGRGLKDIRPIEAYAGLLPCVHGSGLFTRGQTQVMTICTLGMPKEAQLVEDIEIEDKRYMHFYNFPPFSVGEVRPLRGAGRREIGHGALAERALLPVVPLDDPDFPYTVLLVSEVLESNGSTSMASVCGSTLALMDAGVPIKAPVAGIAMGLMSDGKTHKVLTDIQGVEDFGGDMDFKVAGTRKGITALQLDTKLKGIPDEVLAGALEQAREARFQILDIMTKEIAAPRAGISPRAPQLITIQINPEKIGALIGPGGSMIRKITAETGAQIDIQQDGRVLIGASNNQIAEEAIRRINALTQEAKVGTEFRGRVTRLMGRGAMVEYVPGREGLVATEHLSTRKVRRPDDLVKVGDEINVKVFEVDNMGRVNLTALGLEQDLPTLKEQGELPLGSAQGRGGREQGGHRRDFGERKKSGSSEYGRFGGTHSEGFPRKRRSEDHEEHSPRFRPRR